MSSLLLTQLSIRSGSEEGRHGVIEGDHVLGQWKPGPLFAERPYWFRDTADGRDYVTVCAFHRWMSGAVPCVELLPVCGQCEAEHSAARGHARYRHARAAGLLF